MHQFPSALFLLVAGLLTIHHSQSLGQGNGNTGDRVFIAMVSLLQLVLSSYSAAQAAILSEVNLLRCLPSAPTQTALCTSASWVSLCPPPAQESLSSSHAQVCLCSHLVQLSPLVLPCLFFLLWRRQRHHVHSGRHSLACDGGFVLVPWTCPAQAPPDSQAHVRHWADVCSAADKCQREAKSQATHEHTALWRNILLYLIHSSSLNEKLCL